MSRNSYENGGRESENDEIVTVLEMNSVGEDTSQTSK
jgi:hypothetical protein